LIRGKSMASFELLDVIQTSYPNIVNIDVERTAKRIKKAGGSRRNYNLAVDAVHPSCSGYLRERDLIAFLRTHPDEEWHPYLEDVGLRLYQIFGRKPATWHATGRKPVPSVGGLLIKPAIRGVWVDEGRAFPCLINARASIFLDDFINRPFLARGVHEFHVRDSVGVIGPMIVDLGKDPKSGVRANRVHFPTEAEMMSVEQFEDILRRFNGALELAGYKPREFGSAIDMFRGTGTSP
jgi:hypothetical protein